MNSLGFEAITPVITDIREIHVPRFKDDGFLVLRNERIRRIELEMRNPFDIDSASHILLSF
jgi:hypothetical protein